MKKNKLFIIPALMVLLLGSCGSGTKFETKEQLLSKELEYSTKVDFKEFTKLGEKVTSMYDRRLNEDYETSFSYYCYTKHTNFNEVQANYHENYQKNNFKFDVDNKKYQGTKATKYFSDNESSPSGENTTKITCANKDGMFVEREETESSSSKNKFVFERKYGNWEDAFICANQSYDNVGSFILSMFIYDKDLTYYVDGDLYTCANDYMISQIKITESYIACYSNSNNPKLFHGDQMSIVTYSILEYKSINL